MMFNLKNILLIVFFSLSIISNTAFAQFADSVAIQRKSNDIQLKLPPGFSNITNQFPNSNFQNLSFQGIQSPKQNEFHFSRKNDALFEGLFFGQSKTMNIFPNLGGFEHFNNSVTYNANNRFNFNFDFGLLKQNSIITADHINYRFTFGTSVEYYINTWLSLYAYGQFVVPKSKKTLVEFDPLIYMNPLFFQTETGTGLRAKYKNVKADFGLKKIYDTQYNYSNPVNTINTRISIGF